MQVSYLAGLITAALRDADQDQWVDADIHNALYEGEQVIALYHPHATSRDHTLTLAEGIKQNLGDDLEPASYRLLDVKFNVGQTGAPGRSTRRVSMQDLDAINPNWRTASASQVIREWMFDDREPNLFYVNPPAQADTKLQISYSAIPARPSEITPSTEMTVSETYMPALIEWSLYRLFGHDAEGSVNSGRSQQHLQNFAAILGVSLDMLAPFSPKNPEHKR